MWSMVTNIGEALGQIMKGQRKVKPKGVFSLLQKIKLLKMKKKCIAMNLNYLCGLSKNLWNEE